MKAYASKFVAFLKWLIGGTIIGLLLMFVDKMWEQEIRREQTALSEKERIEDKMIEADREASRTELAMRFHEESLQAQKRLAQEVKRLFREWIDSKSQLDIEIIQTENELEEDLHNQINELHTHKAEVINNEVPEIVYQDRIQLSASKEDDYSFSVEGIFEGETINICGYKQFSVQSLENGARFEIATEDRRMPNRKFTGWRRIISSGVSTSLTPSCSVTITSEVAGGNRLIYFEIMQGTDS